jgi:hypothetical protein
MTSTKDAEAVARAMVLESAAKVGKILMEIQAKLDQLREADGGKGAAYQTWPDAEYSAA